MEIILKQIDNIFIFKLIGNLIYEEKNKVEDKFWEIFANSTPEQLNIILDLKLVNTIDTTGVGKLIKYLKIATSQNGDLILINLNHELYTFLEKCRLTNFFKIYTSINQALHYFQTDINKDLLL